MSLMLREIMSLMLRENDHGAIGTGGRVIAQPREYSPWPVPPRRPPDVISRVLVTTRRQYALPPPSHIGLAVPLPGWWHRAFPQTRKGQSVSPRPIPGRPPDAAVSGPGRTPVAPPV